MSYSTRARWTTAVGAHAVPGRVQAEQAGRELPRGLHLELDRARINLRSGRLDDAMKAYQEGFKSVPGVDAGRERQEGLAGAPPPRYGPHPRAHGQDRGGLEGVRDPQEDDRRGRRGGEKQYVPSYHYMAGYLKLEAGDVPGRAGAPGSRPIPIRPFRKLLPARAYERSGDTAAARKAYEEVVASNVNNLERALSYPEAKKKLATLWPAVPARQRDARHGRPHLRSSASWKVEARRDLEGIRIAGDEGHGVRSGCAPVLHQVTAGPSSAGPLRSPAVGCPRSRLRSGRLPALTPVAASPPSACAWFESARGFEHLAVGRPRADRSHGRATAMKRVGR